MLINTYTLVILIFQCAVTLLLFCQKQWKYKNIFVRDTTDGYRFSIVVFVNETKAYDYVKSVRNFSLFRIKLSINKINLFSTLNR